MIRVPVLSKEGLPLMPTKASRARRWLLEGKAKVVHNDLGLFQIQLTVEASGNATQDAVIGIDPGKLFTGIAVQAEHETLSMFHLELPFKTVTERMSTRSMMRRTRRSRRINRKVKFKSRNHREKRFNNRIAKKLPPSIKANKELEQRVIKELLAIYPVSHFIYEIVKARGNRGFSPVQVGQLQQIEWLSSQLPTIIQEGWKTSNLRQYLGLPKNKEDKSKQEPSTHATDAISLACSHFIQYKQNHLEHSADWAGNVTVTNAQFAVVKRPPYSRRQLHLLQFSKGGKRRAYGGSTTINGFRKGDLIMYKSKKETIIGYCSGSTGNLLSISDFNWKRITRAAVNHCSLVAKCTGLLIKVTLGNIISDSSHRQVLRTMSGVPSEV